MNHYNIVITTPGNNFTSNYVKSLTSTIQVLNENKITWTFQNEYSSLITNAREATIVGSRNLEVSNSKPGGGNYTYDKIFCIDSDIVWDPEQFIKLYQSDYSVISGVYLEEEGNDCAIYQYKDSYRMMTKGELNYYFTPFQVYGVGLGFVCIKKGVFEKLSRPWYNLGVSKHVIDGVEYSLPLGEDLFWCERVSKNGDPIYVDPSIIVGHVKRRIVK